MVWPDASEMMEFHLTQIMPGHGYFGKYLNKIEKKNYHGMLYLNDRLGRRIQRIATHIIQVQDVGWRTEITIPEAQRYISN